MRFSVSSWGSKKSLKRCPLLFLELAIARNGSSCLDTWEKAFILEFGVQVLAYRRRCAVSRDEWSSSHGDMWHDLGIIKKKYRTGIVHLQKLRWNPQNLVVWVDVSPWGVVSTEIIQKCGDTVKGPTRAPSTFGWTCWAFCRCHWITLSSGQLRKMCAKKTERGTLWKSEAFRLVLGCILLGHVSYLYCLFFVCFFKYII